MRVHHVSRRLTPSAACCLGVLSLLIGFGLAAPEAHAALAAPVLIAPGNGATGVSTAPTLSWHPVNDATGYGLQVALDEGFTHVVVSRTQAETTAEVTGLSTSTTYWWRVHAYREGHGAGPWSAVWHFTTKAPEPLAAPVLVAPPNGATDQPATVMFKWHPVTGATRYWLQVSRNEGFTDLVANHDGITGTAKAVSGLPVGVKLWWRVKALNATQQSPWSDVWSFTTKLCLRAPTLLSPPNGATKQPTSLVLTWKGVDGAKTYWLQVARDEKFLHLVVNRDGITTTSSEVSGLLAGAKYFWRVKACNGTVQSPWSAIWCFTTLCELKRPVLLHPPNGATNVPTSLVLEWQGVDGATSYWLQVSQNETFTSLLVNRDGITETHAEVSGLPEGTKLWWRVRACSATGRSAWSCIWSFTTASAPH
jgi:hypothetical protein